MSAAKGIVLVLSAPSGAGKTTVVRALMASVENLRFSISFTTRPPRPNEQEGLDYYFISEAVFRAKIDRGEFLEWAEVHGSLYGTGRAETEAVCASGLDILLDVDVQGAEQVRRAMPGAVTVFMLPPSFDELRRRIRSRGSDDPEAIATRLREAGGEAARYREYDYTVVNDRVDDAVRTLRAILVAERTRSGLLESEVQPILDSFE